MGWRGVLVWCPLPMLLLAHSERGTEHFFPRPLTRSGGRGKNVVGRGEGLESEVGQSDLLDLLIGLRECLVRDSGTDRKHA